MSGDKVVSSWPAFLLGLVFGFVCWAMALGAGWVVYRLNPWRAERVTAVEQRLPSLDRADWAAAIGEVGTLYVDRIVVQGPIEWVVERTEKFRSCPYVPELEEDD